MSDKAAGFTGNIPEQYDQGLGPVIFIDYAREMARLATQHGPRSVLEIASGTGIVTRQLRDRLPADAHLTATDLNAPMLDVARSKFTDNERVGFQTADACDLPFPESSFDTVVCQFGLMFFPDKPKSFREVRRVLVPGGRYLFSVWDSHRHNPYARIAHEILGSHFPADPPQFYRVPCSCHELDPIKAMLEETEFTDISIFVSAVEKEIADLPAFARALIYGNPTIDQIRARGGVEPDQIVGTMKSALASAFGTQPAHMPLQAIMLSARRR